MTHAYLQGYDARHDGRPREANPYASGTSDAIWWLKGWQEANVELREVA